MTAAHSSDSRAVVVNGPGVSGVALWRGDGVAPLGAAAHVELEIAGEVSWRDIARRSDTIDPDVRRTARGHDLMVRGIVHEIDHLGVLVLSVAGATVLIDTIGEPPEGVVGSIIVIETHEASVFPAGF